MTGDYAFQELKTHWTGKALVDGPLRKPFGRLDTNARRKSGGVVTKPPRLDELLMVGTDSLPSLGSPAVKQQVLAVDDVVSVRLGNQWSGEMRSESFYIKTQR